jgi:hypothetical protein
MALSAADSGSDAGSMDAEARMSRGESRKRCGESARQLSLAASHSPRRCDSLCTPSHIVLGSITTTWKNGSQLDRRRYQENGNRTKVQKAIENFTSEEILGQFQALICATYLLRGGSGKPGLY